MPTRVIMAGVGHYLPDTEVSSADVEDRVYRHARFRIPRGLVQRVTGVETRRYRTNGEQASDMAVEAGRLALARAELDPRDLDTLIFASCTQDITEPATANIVQHKIAATRAHVLDVKNACNSFLNAVDVADGLIRAGKAERVLVTVGETPSLGINWVLDSAEKLRAGIAGLTLGDAGGAAVLRASPNGSERGILMTRFQTYGSKWRLATVLAGGSMHCFDEGHRYFTGNPRALRGQAIKHIPELVRTALDHVGWRAEQIDVVCCHQVTVELIAIVADRCKIDPRRCMVSIRHCGNTAAASIPIGLSTAFETGALAPGKKVLLVGAAAGFSVGVIPVVW